MADSRMAALTYRIEHGGSVAYDDPPPFERDEPRFRLEVKEGTARFEFKEPLAAKRTAQAAVAEYIDSWQMSADLETGPNSLLLAFVDAEFVDHQSQVRLDSFLTPNRPPIREWTGETPTSLSSESLRPASDRTAERQRLSPHRPLAG